MKYIEINDTEKRLQDFALRQLEFPSLLEYISKYAVSEKAKQIILELQPTSNLDFLNQEHDYIDELKVVYTTEDTIPYEGIAEVETPLHKSLVENAVLNAIDILRISRMMHTSRLLRSFFAQKEELYPSIWQSLEHIHQNRMMEKHIAEAIDDSAEIKDSASRELQRIRRDIIEKTNRLRYRLEKILEKAGDENMTAEDYISIRDGRFVIPIKAEHKRHIPGIIHNVSQTGSTVFLEPSETFEMNNEISMLVSEEKREIYRILKNLTQEIGREARQLLQNYEIVTHFDSCLARAKYALDFGGVKPVLSEENEIVLTKVKHPILCHSKGTKHVIPLTTHFTQEKRGQLISGPNAGGKTVALKSIGINVAMALSGIFPIGECKTNYRIIFTSIGDNQSIENDLSTFSSQVLQLKNIIDNCSTSSLILIDEICSGTDPQEGAALASGILDTFIHLNAFFIVTTHQSSLKTYSLNRDEIENASLEFNEEKLKPTYKFLLSIPGNSYAFELAKNIGLSDLVIKRAKKYLGNKHSAIEESIKLLQKYKFEAEEYRREMLQEKLKVEKLKNEYQTQLNQIKLRKNDIVSKAHSEANQILNNANSLIERTIKEIREEKKPIVEVKQEFNAEKEKIKEEVRRAKKVDIETPEDLKVGDLVKIIDSNFGNGVVQAIYPKSESALLDINGMKFKVKVNTLRRCTHKAAPPQKTRIDNYRFDTKHRIDLRGQRAEEAISEIDRLISDALLASIHEITILHGKGTGALRSAIHKYLQDNPTVVKFRTGTLEEGGDGITVVQL